MVNYSSDVVWVIYPLWTPFDVIMLSYGLVLLFGWVSSLFQSTFARFLSSTECGAFFWCIICSPPSLLLWTACMDIKGILWMWLAYVISLVLYF